MFRNFFKTLGSFGIYLLAFFIPALILIYWCQANLFAPYDSSSNEVVNFMVEESWTSGVIAEQLEKQKLIRNTASITFITKYKMNDEERKNLRIVAGEYALSPNMKPAEILQTLIKGDVLLHEMQIPAGANLTQVAKISAETGLVSEEGLIEAFRDRDTLAQLGVPAYIPEGFLVEGDYQFTRPSRPTDMVKKLVQAGNKKLDELVPDWRKRSEALGFQPYDILKLASLIEKETKNPDERKIIASLLHNRLRIGLPLQSDAALIYEDPALAIQGVTDLDRKSAGPYNTYLSTGLPLTPICSLVWLQ